MKCKKAKELISLNIDSALSVKEERLLKQHLSNCSSCFRYNQQMQSLTAELTEVSNSIEQQGISSKEYTDRLHNVLLNEYYFRSKEPVNMIEEFIQKHVFHPRSKPRKVFYTMAVATILIFAVVYSVFSLFNVPVYSRTEHCFGHFAAFNAKTMPDGRVYADLNQQSSTGHLIKNRGDLK